MLELLKVDLYKLTKSSLVKIVFFISVLSAALMYLLSHLLATGELPIQNTGILSLFADSQMFILLGCVFIGIFLCSDFEYKVIENAVLAGHSRSSIVTSKMISLVIFVSLLTVPYFAVILFSTAARTCVSAFGLPDDHKACRYGSGHHSYCPLCDPCDSDLFGTVKYWNFFLIPF